MRRLATKPREKCGTGPNANRTRVSVDDVEKSLKCAFYPDCPVFLFFYEGDIVGGLYTSELNPECQPKALD
jgi:hypothetical protein